MQSYGLFSPLFAPYSPLHPQPTAISILQQLLADQGASFGCDYCNHQLEITEHEIKQELVAKLKAATAKASSSSASKDNASKTASK